MAQTLEGKKIKRSVGVLIAPLTVLLYKTLGYSNQRAAQKGSFKACGIALVPSLETSVAF